MLTDNKYINRLCWFLLVVWIVGLLSMTFIPKSYGEDSPIEPYDQELTTTDKAKIAVGTCLFGLFWADTTPEETEYIYEVEDGVENPIPIGIIKKKRDP